MTRRITVSVQATIYLPDQTPGNDYVRAVGNYLADKLGTMPSTGADFSHVWRPGRDVEVLVDGNIGCEMNVDAPTDFQHGQQGALL